MNNEYICKAHVLNYFYEKLLTFLFSVISVMGMSQTGPGGVGTTDGNSELVLWLKADAINRFQGPA